MRDTSDYLWQSNRGEDWSVVAWLSHNRVANSRQNVKE